MKRLSPRTLALLAAAASGLCFYALSLLAAWAASDAGGRVSPATAAMGRFLFSVMIMVSVPGAVSSGRILARDMKDSARVLRCALGCSGVLYVMVSATANAGLAALTSSVQVFVGPVAAAWVLRERLTVRNCISLGLAVGSIIVGAGGTGSLSVSGPAGLGVLSGLLGGLMALQVRALRRYGAVDAFGLTFLWQAGALAWAAAVVLAQGEVAIPTPLGLLCLAGEGVLGLLGQYACAVAGGVLTVADCQIAGLTGVVATGIVGAATGDLNSMQAAAGVSAAALHYHETQSTPERLSVPAPRLTANKVV